ncbi:ABC transporter ATP-binding protein [Bosea sp. R86505]|uniref:ABC transporter ATP-binding protein n=1 Tax=Bosea sp. R86505 TaxID=3101710 RepID=UPI00366BB5BE
MAFVFASSGWHQLRLSLLSVAVFTLSAAPLEIQRRIVDAAVRGSAFRPILLLTTAYLGVVLAFGLIKLATNIYRGWLAESAVRTLRLVIDERLKGIGHETRHGLTDAVSLSMILAECDDLGGFVGTSISVPVLEGGFLATVFAYLIYLQPWMALVGLAVLTPQLAFVPLMQSAINCRVARRITLLRQVGRDILVVQTVPAGHDERAKFDLVFDLNMGVLKLKTTMNFLMNFTYTLGIGAILGFGGWLVVHGQTEIATVVTFVSALGRIVDPWNDLVDWARSLAVSATKYRLVEQEILRMNAQAGSAPLPSSNP